MARPKKKEAEVSGDNSPEIIPQEISEQSCFDEMDNKFSPLEIIQEDGNNIVEDKHSFSEKHKPEVIKGTVAVTGLKSEKNNERNSTQIDIMITYPKDWNKPKYMKEGKVMCVSFETALNIENQGIEVTIL